MTASNPRIVTSVEGLRNLRDIGGLPAVGGRVTRPGVVYRAEAPAGLSPDAVQALSSLHLRCALDLRDESEDVFLAPSLPEGVRRIYVGITPPADPGGRGQLQQMFDGDLPDFSAADLGSIYVRFIEQQPRAFGRAIELLADPDNHPALVHCHIGKDRTGLVVAMVLSIIGVQLEAIMADYELTSVCRAYRRADVEADLVRVGTEWDRVSAMFMAPAAALEMALDAMERPYGSVRGFLTGPGGVDEPTIDRLTDLLLIDG